jgi:hypothetical protein
VKIEFRASDFRPLDDFPLLWRWSRAGTREIPARALGTIRPLSKAKAEEIAPEALRLALPRPTSELELSIATDWDDSEPVRSRLSGLPVSPDTVVIVSWNASTAALTVWSSFVQFWDDFCYPSSDDVTVWAPGEPWCLNYRHFQFIEYGPATRAV